MCKSWHRMQTRIVNASESPWDQHRWHWSGRTTLGRPRTRGGRHLGILGQRAIPHTDGLRGQPQGRADLRPGGSTGPEHGDELVAPGPKVTQLRAGRGQVVEPLTHVGS